MSDRSDRVQKAAAEKEGDGGENVRMGSSL